MNKIESFEDLIFDLTASRNSAWYKAGVRIDVYDEDELKSMLDRDVKPQSKISFTPDDDDYNHWEGPYFYIFREGAPDMSNVQDWEIDYREIVFECHCATMAGPKVLKKLAKAFEKLFDQKAEKNEEPLFNVYFETDTEESGEPEYTDQTMEQCKEICEKIYDAYLKGNLNPWNWGTINPETENFTVICSCSNGYTEDEFGMCTWGPQAGKFVDYPKEVANKSYKESIERITKSPLKESSGVYDVYFVVYNVPKLLDGYLAEKVSLEEGKALCEKFMNRFNDGEFDPWYEYNVDGGPGESCELNPDDDELSVVCMGDDDTDEYGITTFGPQAWQFVKNPMSWDEFKEWWKSQK